MKKRKQVYTMGVIYVKEKEQDVQQRTEHRRVKNSTLLRSRVEFLIKSFCFFTVYLTGGTATTSVIGFCFIVVSPLQFRERHAVAVLSFTLATGERFFFSRGKLSFPRVVS